MSYLYKLSLNARFVDQITSKTCWNKNDLVEIEKLCNDIISKSMIAECEKFSMFWQKKICNYTDPWDTIKLPWCIKWHFLFKSWIAYSIYTMYWQHKCIVEDYYVSPSNEGRHIVLVWFFLLLLLSEACPDHNFFVFPDRSIIFGMWVHDHKVVCHIP